MASHHFANPLDSVSLDNLLAWCDEKPEERYQFIAGAITLYEGKTVDGSESKWGRTALAILNKAPDRIAVLTAFFGDFVQRAGAALWQQ